MKINYSSKYVNGYLMAAFIYLTLGLFLVYYLSAHYANYVWFLFAAVYIAIYLYYKREKYLTIEKGVLKVNRPFGKKVILADVNQVKVYGGEFILRSAESQLKINTQIIAPDSLDDLKRELDKLNLK